MKISIKSTLSQLTLILLLLFEAFMMLAQCPDITIYNYNEVDVSFDTNDDGELIWKPCRKRSLTQTVT